jgi:hypothetical protein
VEDEKLEGDIKALETAVTPTQRTAATNRKLYRSAATPSRKE